MARSKGLNVPITSDATALQRESRKAVRALETVDQQVQRLSGGTKHLNEQQRQQILEQAKAAAEAKRYQSALRTLGVEEQAVTRHIQGHSKALQTGRHHAEEAVVANAALTGSFKGMARSAATAGAGFLAAYVGISKAKDAIKSTEELAHATEILHRNTGLSVKSSSDWIATAQARHIQASALNMSFTKLSQTFLKADVGQKASVQTLKALGLSQAEVHAGAQDFGKALSTTADKLGAMKGGTERLAIAQTVLGRGAKDLIPLFADGSKGMQEQLDMAKKYGVELNAKTLPLLDKLVANQRQTKLASLGLKVAFTTAVAPSLLKVEGASLRLARIWADPRLTNEQKWHRIGKAVGGLWKTAKGEFDKDLPKIADQVAKDAPKVALAFVHGFANAGLGGKLVLGGWLLKKMGGLGAFTALGRKGGAAMGVGVAEGAAAGESAGFFAKAGRLMGGVVGTAAVAVIGAKIASKLDSTAVDLVTGGLVKSKRQIQIEHDVGVLNRAQRLGLERDTGPRGSTTRADLTVAAQHAQRSGRLGLAGDLRQIEKDFPKIQPGNIDKARQAFDKYSKSAKDAKAATKDMTAKTVNLIAGWRRTAESDVSSTAKTMGLKSKEGQQDVVAAFKASAAGIKRAMDSGQISTKAGMREMRNIMGIYSKAGKDAVAKNTALFVGNVRDAMRQGKLATKDGLEYIHTAFVKEARSFGLSKPAALQLAGVQQLQSQGTAVTGRAGGGWIGSPGEAGQDQVPIVVGRGEAVLSRHQQAPVEAALNAVYGMGLDDLFARVQRPHYMAKGGRARFAAGGKAGGYVYPVPGFTWAGVDEGVDFSGSGKIGAIGTAKFLRVAPQNSGTGWPGAGDGGHGNRGAMITYQLMDGPRKGKIVYLAENVDPVKGLRSGSVLQAGQAFAHARGQFPYLETGWSDAHGTPLAHGHYVNHQATPEGRDFDAFLKGLAHGKIVGGGSFGTAAYKAIKRLRVTGRDSSLKRTVQGALDKSRESANKKLKSLAAKSSSSVGGANLATIGTAALKGHGHAANRAWARKNMPWPKSQWNALSQLWQHESGWDEHAGHPSAAYGVPQADPGTKMASEGRDWLNNPVTQMRWGFKYIKGRYGTPSKAWAGWYGGNLGGQLGYGRGGFVGRRFQNGGYVTAAGNPYLAPTSPKHHHHKGPKPPGTSRHWNPFTHAYAFVTSAVYTGWLHQWQSRHPSLPMPGGPTTKHAPTPTTDISPLNGQTETHLPAEWKKIRLHYRQQQAAQARAVKHENVRISHITGGALGDLNAADNLIAGADQASQDVTAGAAAEQHRYDANPPDLTTPEGRAAYGAHTASQVMGIVGAGSELMRERNIVRAKARRYKEAIKRLQRELKRKHLPAASRKHILSLIHQYQREYRALQKQAHDLGIQIEGLSVDLGTEQTDAATGELSGILGDIDLHEQAGDITPEEAARERHEARQAALGGAYGPLTAHDTLQVRADDKQAQDASTAATGDNTQALKDLKASIDAQRQVLETVGSVGNSQAIRLMADMLSGYWGPRTTARGTTPSRGTVATA